MPKTKKIFFNMRYFLFFLLVFIGFSSYAVSIETNHSTHMYPFFTVTKVPVDVRVTQNSIVYSHLRWGNSESWSDSLGSPSFPITDESMIGRTVWGNTYSKDEPLVFDLVYCPHTSACSNEICGTCLANYCKNHSSHVCGSDPDPDNPDPDNPDPDNPDPDNPDPSNPDPDDPDNPDDSEGAWALETTLQNVKTLISDSNTLSKKISDDLASQLLEVLAISSATSNIESGVDSMKGYVSSMKGDVSSMKVDVNSIQSGVNSMKSDVKSIRSDVGRIKDVLSGGESPSSPSRLDRIDVTSSRWEILKKKLLPSYSFFDTMSGPSSYRFSFIFSYPYAPASSSIAAIIDFPIANDASGSINLGSSVVGAFNNFVAVFRSVLLVLMAWCFLKVVIKTLRQW